MIDTVRVSTPVRLDIARVMRSGFQRVERERLDAAGVSAKSLSFIRQDKAGPPHFIKYRPPPDDGEGELILETSLPKIVFGTNIPLLPESYMPDLFADLSNRVADVCGEIPPVGDWQIRGRADFAFAWRAGDSVSNYLSAFRLVDLPRHVNSTVDRQGTQYWFNSSRRLRMYDKFAESLDTSAKGVLRFEVQLNHAKVDLAKFGIDSLKLCDIAAWSVSEKVLSHYLRGVSAMTSISGDVLLAKKLLRTVGAPKARRLLGSMYCMRLMSRGELRDIGFERTMIWRDVRALERAGVSRAVIEGGERAEGLELPPLALPSAGGYTGEFGRLN